MGKRRTTPSVVRWPPGADTNGPPPEVGERALARGGGAVIRCAKRIIGQPFDSPGVQSLLKSLPFEASPGPSGEAGVLLSHLTKERTTWVSPVDVSAAVLRELRGQAEAYLSAPASHRQFDLMGQALGTAQPVSVTRCVIGVPVYFNEVQRAATREAATRAGFLDVSVMAESTAAAVAYGLFVAGTKTVLVFDAGGGTTDVTLLRVNEGTFEVLAAAGDNQLGGEDLDSAVALAVLAKHRGSAPMATDADLLRCPSLREACNAARVCITLLPKVKDCRNNQLSYSNIVLINCARVIPL